MIRKYGIQSALTVLLAATIFFTACTPEATEEQKVYAATPVISIHPTSVNYTGNAAGAAAIEALEVVASVSDGGTISYQWYTAETFTNTGGSPIAGETEAVFTPDEAGYYYVVITNRRDGVEPQVKASNPARIQILASAPAAPAVSVTVSSNNAQYIRGFGGMSNAFGINPSDVVRYIEVKDIDTMFNPDTGLGFNILRIMLWPNPLEDVLTGQVEPQMRNQTTYLEVVKRVNQYGGYVMASPWTPLPEWKKNESTSGTSPSYLLPENYGNYARYLGNFAKAMAEQGAPIYTLSIQNEPTWPASYAGCEWTAQQQLDFFKNTSVGRFMNNIPGYGGGQSFNKVLVMSGEPHQRVTWNNLVRDDPAANALVDIYAYHIYDKDDMNNPYTDVQQDNDNGRKEVWMTEHNLNSGSGLEAQDYSWNYVWMMAEEIDHVIRINSSNAFVWWYLKRYYSMIGENAYGTVNGQVLPRGYVMSHWAKYATDTVRAPAVVTGHPDGGNANDSSGTGKGSKTTYVKASAFRRKANPVSYWENQVKNREDSISLVIFNQKTSYGKEQDIRVNLPTDFGSPKYAQAIISDRSGKRHAPHLVQLTKTDTETLADFTLPPNSIVSIKFIK